MKCSFVLLAVSCWLSAVSAQWLEETIYLPDSFGGLAMPQSLVYDSANNTIYVGGLYGSVPVIDGATDQKDRSDHGCVSRCVPVLQPD